jgi:hypothetical protein
MVDDQDDPVASKANHHRLHARIDTADRHDPDFMFSEKFTNTNTGPCRSRRYLWQEKSFLNLPTSFLWLIG